MQLRSRDDASYYALYQYTPELAPAIIAAALFLLGTIAHIRAATQLRCKIFIPFVIGCLSTYTSSTSAEAQGLISY